MDERAERRLRRSRRRWRFIAVFALGVIAGYLFWPSDKARGPYVARIEVAGLITDDPARDAMLRRLAEDADVKALIVDINSPGGTVAGSEALYETLRHAGEGRPVAAVMREAAASGGFITALAADHIVARGGSITASVGVIFSAPNFHGLMERVGVAMVEVKSGELKAEPAPYAPVDEAKLIAERELVDDSFAWFLALVRERRAISDETAELIADGRILTGRRAAELGLVDAVGGSEAARDWLESQGVSRDLPVIDVRPPSDDWGVVGWILGRSGTRTVDSLTGLVADAWPQLLVIHR